MAFARRGAARDKATLPRGQQSFHLGGWSMGGVVAFEMALQLRRKTTG